MYRKWVKRLLDILLSGAALVVLCIPMGVIALWIKLDSPGPVLFRQKRVGKNKVLFDILKFRTMRTDTPHDMPTHMLKNPDAFITKSGHFLRKTSLDELPQLWNIFVGQMSVVGPRPALWNQYDLIEERDKYGANDVTPGLTGWAQVNGLRGDTSIKERIEHDVYYIENWSILLDIKILFLTLFKGFVNQEKLN